MTVHRTVPVRSLKAVVAQDDNGCPAQVDPLPQARTVAAGSGPQSDIPNRTLLPHVDRANQTPSSSQQSVLLLKLLLYCVMREGSPKSPRYELYNICSTFCGPGASTPLRPVRSPC